MLVVASAGNNGRDIDQQPSYPASIAAPNLITVAATDPQGGRDLSGFSNFGALDVQIAAPGGQILSTAKDGGFAVMSGTSMAAPMVTGVASLVADLAYFYRGARPAAPRFTLTTGGTSAGIADTARGIADAGMVSRALTAEDPPGLTLTTLARSGVCLVSNRANPIASISRAQLQDLVAGRVTSWSGFAGSRRTDAIVPVTLAPTTGGGRVFQSVFVDDGTPVAWTPVTLISSTQARDYVEQTPSAFGYADLALTSALHVIAYEGVGCDRQTIRDGRYPASRPLGIVTRGTPRGALARFLSWVRTSPTARRVIAANYVP